MLGNAAKHIGLQVVISHDVNNVAENVLDGRSVALETTGHSRAVNLRVVFVAWQDDHSETTATELRRPILQHANRRLT